MPRIIVDGVPHDVAAGDNLLEALLGLKQDIPYFCWHPAMGSVGSCRQCAVVQFQNAEDQRGRLVMACMTPVTDNAIISVTNERAVSFRKSVIENLMLSHPHDCPVCEEGGECHLQDMTVMSGHHHRAYRGLKRTHRNQYLGPFINHEMNRCITCYRCVRFYQDYAGGSDLAAFASHDRVYFGRHEPGVLESEFAGNLVEVCPTGVFTDKTLSEKYTRKWDLQSAPSICAGCGLGCNTIVSERYGELRRIHNRYNHAINGYFLCDRGRFGGGFVNNKDRIPACGIRVSPGRFKPAGSEETLERVKSLLGGAKRIVGIGSPRASLESNHLLRKLVGDANFYTGASGADQRCVALIRSIMTTGPSKTLSLREVEDADAVLVLGEDITNTSARLALALRQMIGNAGKKLAAAASIPLWHDAAVRKITQDLKSPLMLLTTGDDRLRDAASLHHATDPARIARLGQAIAHRLDASFAGVGDLTAEEAALADRVAQTLREAQRPVIISGSGLLDTAVIQASANVAWALQGQKETRLLYCVAECNSMGVDLLASQPKTLDDLLESTDPVDVAIVVENDLYRRAEAGKVDNLLARVKSLIVLDSLDTPTASAAELVLPAATFAETEGTLVNNEGRAQRSFAAFPPKGDIQGSWSWLLRIGRAIGAAGFAGINHFDDATASCAAVSPALAGITAAAPGARFRTGAGQKIARMTHRASGRTAMRANISVHEPQQPLDDESPFTFSMEGANAQKPGSLPAALTPHVWSPGWNSNNAIHKYQQSADGELLGEHAGCLLLTAATKAEGLASRFPNPPAASTAKAPRLRLVPRYHLFGSDELSARSRAIAQLVPQSYFAVSPADAAALGVAEGDGLETRIGGRDYRLAVVIDPATPPGCVQFPAGLTGTQGLVDVREGNFAKAANWVAQAQAKLIKTDR